MKRILLALVILLATASPAYADHLYSPEAGFPTANRLRVWQEGTNLNLHAIIQPWNRAATVAHRHRRRTHYHRRTLFIVSSASPQITFKPSDYHQPSGLWQTYVQGYPTNESTYTHVTIFVGDQNNLRTLQHELGHALGLADHQLTSAWPRYRGVMAYDDWGLWGIWFKTQDRQMIRRLR